MKCEFFGCGKLLLPGEIFYHKMYRKGPKGVELTGHHGFCKEHHEMLESVESQNKKPLNVAVYGVKK